MSKPKDSLRTLWNGKLTVEVEQQKYLRHYRPVCSLREAVNIPAAPCRISAYESTHAHAAHA